MNYAARFCSWFICLILLGQSAQAAMSLDRMVVYFDANAAPRQDIIVTNPDEETLYLQTEIYKVLNPGSEREERVKVIDPSEIKLLTSPQKAIIPPKGRKTFRLVSLETPKDKEAVYRITFRPVTGELTATQNAIKVLVAYQALVFVRPKDAEYKVSARKEGEQLVFTNTGNTNVVLRNGQYCSSNDSDSCVDLENGTRLYGGDSWELPLENQTGYVQYGLFDGKHEVVQQFFL